MLLFHTLTGELLLLSSPEWPVGESSTSLHTYMVSHRFLVPEGYDETTAARELRALVSMLPPRDSAITDYTVFTTTGCNARCAYCFENGRTVQTMTEQTAADTADYILRHAQGRPVKLHWFGGEPLLNGRSIDIICTRLREEGIRYRSIMTSNGLLFDPGAVEKARELWQLQNVQIAVDGTEREYNRIKAYTNPGTSPYLQVMDNIAALLEAGIHVVVRLNMDSANADELCLAAREISERFRGKGGLYLHVQTLHPHEGCLVHPFRDEGEKQQKLRALGDIIRTEGRELKRYLPEDIMRNTCMADSPHAVTVLPDGGLGKCDFYTDEHRIGSIYREGTDAEELRHIGRLREETELCRACPAFPMCRRLCICGITAEECTPARRDAYVRRIRNAMLNTWEKADSKDGNDCAALIPEC